MELWPKGTNVITFDGVEGVVVESRATMPGLDRRFTYVVEIDFGDEIVKWGYHSKELSVKP